MLKHGNVSTEVDLKPFLFTLIAGIGSGVGAVLLFVFGKGGGLAIFAGVLGVIVALVSLVVLFAMVTDYAYIEYGVLHTRYLFKKAVIPLETIGKVTCKENIYYIYGKRQNLLATVNGLLLGIDTVLETMDNNGVQFE